MPMLVAPSSLERAGSGSPDFFLSFPVIWAAVMRIVPVRCRMRHLPFVKARRRLVSEFDSNIDLVG